MTRLSQEDPLPYAFYVNDLELTEELGKHLLDNKGETWFRVA